MYNFKEDAFYSREEDMAPGFAIISPGFGRVYFEKDAVVEETEELLVLDASRTFMIHFQQMEKDPSKVQIMVMRMGSMPAAPYRIMVFKNSLGMIERLRASSDVYKNIVQNRSGLIMTPNSKMVN